MEHSYPTEPPEFTEWQVLWLEDLIVNKLTVVWAPLKNKKCDGCVRATETVINAIRSLRK